MPTKLSVLFLLLSTINAWGRTDTLWLSKAKRDSLYGYIDTVGREVVPIKYTYAGGWGSGLVTVNIGGRPTSTFPKGGKWGYCNTTGYLVIPAIYDHAARFACGRAAVRIGELYGFINPQGKLIADARYSKVDIFSEGLCAVMRGKLWGYIDTNGQEVIRCQFQWAGRFQNGVASVRVAREADNKNENVCLINKNGKRKTTRDYYSISDFHDGLAMVETIGMQPHLRSKVGYIDTAGHEIIPPVYDEGQNFSEGLAAVAITDSTETVLPGPWPYRSMLFGYIDSSGKEVIPMQYSEAGDFHNGVAIVTSGRQSRTFTHHYKDTAITGYVDPKEFPTYAAIRRDGSFIQGLHWDFLRPIDSGRYIAQRICRIGYGVINAKGDTLLPFIYTNLHYAGSNIFVADDGGGRDALVSIVDINNHVLFGPKYALAIGPEMQFGMILIQLSRKDGVIWMRPNGQAVIHGYSYLSDFEPVIYER